MGDYETIVYREEGGVGVLTLNRPKTLNAINLEMIEEIEDLFGKLEKSETARVLILTGAGEKGFCAGLDMKTAAGEIFEGSPALIYQCQSRFSRIYYMMRVIPQPVIAAIHGAAAGGGFSFAMASDVRIITPQAKFNAAYINIGLGGADLASSYFLPRLIGSGRANEFLLTGDFMTAQEAMDLGFASRMVEKETLMDTAREIAARMVEKSPLGLKMTKEAINQNLGVTSLEQALHIENRNQAFMITAMKTEK
ncbi:Enoyl-CoA hydratase/isomerase [Candidatus Desulfarcum epimagneticum]|uniref:Enoyl-CoA hydratase/isomerase n=1 Tax=uncultured Desulfobacteraceae bacterium TaxID=218296 RepID=A0A484HJV9_9BACT|nr:Enoyl-CoA hydratase/isomerase [uncultured Desulfobacteraceae bacterium]